MRIEGTILTRHDMASCIAESVATDNLSEMNTHAENNDVITHITSTKIRSVIASMDDYLTNIIVAEELCKNQTIRKNSYKKV